MAPKSVFQTMALVFSLFAFTDNSGAQDAPGMAESTAAGFRTDQLSPRQIRVWNAIRKIALAPDKQGRPMHPVLYRL